MRTFAKTFLLSAAAAACLFSAMPSLAQERSYRQEVMSLTAADGRVVPTLLTFPKSGMNLNAPAIIHCQGGPGASPLEGSGPWIAAGMAEQGYTVIAPMVRHGDALFDTDFKDYAKDVKAAVDQLVALGFRQIVLTGSSFGSITITRYMIDTQDPRITALIHFAPTEDTGPFTRRGMGEEEFRRQNDAAAQMIARNATDEIFAPEFDAPPPMPKGTKFAFFTTPDRWITMWGAGYGAVNIALFPKIKVPMLLLAGGNDGYSTKERLYRLQAAATGSPKVDVLYYPGNVDHSFNSNPPVQPKVIIDVAAWLNSVGLGIRPAIKTEVVTITDTEPGTRAFRYVPSMETQSGTAFLTVHDFTGSAFAGPPNWLAEGAAQAGYFAIGMQTNRGSRGMMGGTYATSSKDIGAWIGYLEKHGYAKVVLVGHGFGATRAAQYLAATHDRRVAGLVMAAPAPDSAAFLRGKIGADAYEKALTSAHTHASSSDYRDLIYLKHLRADVPTDMAGGTLVMTPAAFLDAWGPDAPVLSKLVGHLGVPVLLLGGGDDPRLPLADFQRLKVASVTARLYPGTGQALTGSEAVATDDMLQWAVARHLVPKASGVPQPPVPIATPMPSIPAVSPHGQKVGGTPETAG